MQEHSSAASASDSGNGSSTAAHAATASIPSSSGSGDSGLSVLTSTEPIDRLRYQAMLVFDHWDKANTGRLTGQQLDHFFTWCTRKVREPPLQLELGEASLL